jgi:threonine/homoserine/homoserine lactone efflux protein
VNGALLVTYLLTITVLMVTPGPDMLFCLASGLRGGPRAGFAAALGAATGEIVHIGASAVGLAAVFRAAPPLYHAVRIVGAAYLVWLGISALRSRGRRHLTDGVASSAHAYRRGLTTNLLNPKMALFAIAFLPQFVDPRAGNVALQFLVLGVCFVVLEIVVDGTVGVLAGHFARVLRGRRARRNLDLAAGSVYLGLGAKVALSR